MEIQILSLIITLLAVIVGPLISIWITKKQIVAQLVYADRLSDVKEFRETINNFLADMAKLTILVNDKKSGNITTDIYQEKFDVLYNMMLFNKDKLALLIDIKTNDTQMQLYIKVRSSLEIILDTNNPKWQDEVTKVSNKIAELAIEVISNEKTRIKNLI